MNKPITSNYSELRQSGMTLIEMLLSMLVLGLVSIAAMQLYTNHNNSLAHLKINGELEDTRNYVRNALNCAETIAGQVEDCSNSQSINLKRSNGATFVAKYTDGSAAGTVLGANIEVKASCKDEGGFYSINLDYRRRKNGELLTDPLKGTTQDWSSLTKNVPLVCRKENSYVDYLSCSNSPSLGYQPGGGKCTGGNVLIAVNDGIATGMSCCPIETDILSVIPAEQNIIRSGSCAADEVATGMVDMVSRVYCTKINRTKVKLVASSPTEFMSTSSAPTSEVFKRLVSIYHRLDCCACPEGSVAIGNHLPVNNVCADKCVKIVKLEP